MTSAKMTKSAAFNGVGPLMVVTVLQRMCESFGSQAAKQNRLDRIRSELLRMIWK